MSFPLTLEGRTATTFTVSVIFDVAIDSYNLYATSRGMPAAKNTNTLVLIDSFLSVDTGGGKTAFVGNDYDYYLADRDLFYVAVTAVTAGVETFLISSEPLLISAPTTGTTTAVSTSSLQSVQLAVLDPETRLLIPVTGEYDTVTGRVNLHTESSASLTVSDLEIGAVEIKNATTDDRVIVSSDGGLSIIPATRTNRHYTFITNAALPAAFPGAAQAVFGFTSRGFSISIEAVAGATVIEYSFNGAAVHGRLSDTGLTAESFDFRTETQIFVRKTSGTADVVIKAW